MEDYLSEQAKAIAARARALFMDPRVPEPAEAIAERVRELPRLEAEQYIEQACGGDERLLADVRSRLSDVPELTQRAPKHVSLDIGTLLDGRYLLEKWLGEGGFAVTWLARDRRLDSRSVVIKIPTRLDRNDPWLEEKFRGEIKALAAIDHPGVVAPLDIGQLEDGRPYLVLEYVDGTTLRRLIKQGAVPIERTANILRQIGRALEAVHACGIYHRDLKPENVMVQTLRDVDYVRIIDFGISTITQSSEPVAVETRVAGSLGYMAPEQYRGKVTSTTDVYALGAIAFELITGDAPLPPGNVADDGDDGAAPYQFEANAAALPPRVKTLIGQALSQKAARRPSNIRDFAEQLAQALTESAGADTPVPAPQVPEDGDETGGSRLVPSDPHRPRLRAGLIWTMTAVGSLVAAVALAMMMMKQPSSPPAEGSRVTPQSEKASEKTADDPQPFQQELERARVLAQRLDVNGLLQLRAEVAATPAATANRNDVEAALKQVEIFLADARRRQADIDSRRATPPPDKPRPAIQPRSVYIDPRSTDVQLRRELEPMLKARGLVVVSSAAVASVQVSAQIQLSVRPSPVGETSALTADFVVSLQIRDTATGQDRSPSAIDGHALAFGEPNVRLAANRTAAEQMVSAIEAAVPN